MKIILWFIVILVSVVFSIKYLERNSIYYPMKTITATPQIENLSFEDIYFTADDNTQLNGWFIPANNAKFTILLAHGNAGNIGHRLEKILIFHNMGLNVFVFDYRGYGKSAGTPREAGLYKDMFAAYNYLTKTRGIPKSNIIIYGESIGGAVAIDLAQKVNAKALITEETFTSVKDMAKTAFPFIPSFIFSSRFNAIGKIKNVKCRKLIIHSIDDEIVPFSMGERLFTAAGEPKTFLKIRGSHNTAFLDSKEEYTKGIENFINQ